MMREDVYEQRVFDELHRIREELRALRKEFEKRGIGDQLESRIKELEVEERLREIQDEYTGRFGKAPRWRWFTKG